MGRVTWGGDGSMYRRSCEASNYGYVERKTEDGGWDRLGNQFAYEVSADSNGTPWIVSKGGQDPVKMWTGDSWLTMGLKDAYNINAGPPGHIYATAPPNLAGGQTLYKYGGMKYWI